MQMVRELPVTAHEIMLDVGNLEWVTAYIIGGRAWILPPDKRATAILLRNRSKQNEMKEFFLAQFDVTIVFFPLEGG